MNAPAANHNHVPRQRQEPSLHILFFSTFPMVIWLFKGSFASILTAVILMALFALALRYIWLGQQAQVTYSAAVSAARPLPYKLIGSGLIGLFALTLAGHNYQSVVIPLLLGALATGLSIAAFGTDPLEDKTGAEAPDTTTSEAEDFVARQTRLLDNAIAKLRTLGDDGVLEQTQAACAPVRKMLSVFGEDPDDLRYLQNPIAKFASIVTEDVARLANETAPDAQAFARTRFVAKLDVLREALEARAVRTGVSRPLDAFDHEAELLLDRMPRDSAA